MTTTDHDTGLYIVRVWDNDSKTVFHLHRFYNHDKEGFHYVQENAEVRSTPGTTATIWHNKQEAIAAANEANEQWLSHTGHSLGDSVEVCELELTKNFETM